MRTSLGRRTPGLARLLWAPNAEVETERFVHEHESLTVSEVPSQQQIDSLLSGLDDKEAHQFYLVDPRGYLMMYYTPEQNYKEIIRDLKFLLTQSGY